MILNFEKWHGCKNDFIIIWSSKSESSSLITSLQNQASTLCNRDGSSIGADGILLLIGETRESIVPNKLKIINKDGSIAQNCGNGIRCAASSVYKKYLEHGNQHDDFETLHLDIEGNKFICHYIGNRDNINPFVSVSMGQTYLNKKNAWNDSLIKKSNQIIAANKLSYLSEEVGTCTIGNPHIIYFNNNTSRDQVVETGPLLQNLDFLDGINVHIASPSEPSNHDQQIAGQVVNGKISKIYKAFTWERGVGETQACGSGAAAIASLALESGFLERDLWVAIDMPGGRLYAKQKKSEDSVTLAGPTEFVFSGRIHI